MGRLALIGAVALGFAGCAAEPPPSPGEQAFWILTSERATSGPCPMAAAEGVLMPHPRSGLGVRGRVTEPVRWPFGFSARLEEDGRVALLDRGRVVGHTSERVRFGGGLDADDVFTVCPDRVTRVASEP